MGFRRAVYLAVEDHPCSGPTQRLVGCGCHNITVWERLVCLLCSYEATATADKIFSKPCVEAGMDISIAVCAQIFRMQVSDTDVSNQTSTLSLTFGKERVLPDLMCAMSVISKDPTLFAIALSLL